MKNWFQKTQLRCSAVVLSLLSFCTSLQAQDDLDMQALLQPVDSNNIFIAKDYYNWCSSVVKGKDGLYHMFYSRWSHGVRTDNDDSLNFIFNGFKGWNKYSEIAYAVSKSPTGPFKHVRTVLKGTGDPARWDRFTYHNPLVREYDGYYYLYFISNSFDPDFKLNKPADTTWLQWLKYNCTQKVGVVKARSLEDLAAGKFEMPVKCIMAPDNQQTFEVATNPSVTKGPDGKYYMMYKSRRPNVGHMTFWMAVADKPDGPFVTKSAVLNGAEFACEDPTLWYDAKRKRFYAVAKNFSNSGKLAPEFGALVLITSVNGFDWEPAQHSVVSLRTLKFTDGHSQPLANLERPFVLFDNKGNMISLMAAAAVESPFKGDPQKVTPASNSFIVQIPLKH